MSVRTLATVLLLSGVGAAAASARLHRCVSAEGTPVFADRPCHMLGVRPAGIPAVPASPPATAETPAEPEPLPGLCPAPDGESLRRAVRRAFARRRVNDLAALYHWVGSTRASSILVMNRLAELLRHPLAEVAFDPPFDEREWSADESRLPDLRLDLGLPDAEVEPESVWFRLRRHTGCLWLSF